MTAFARASSLDGGLSLAAIATLALVLLAESVAHAVPRLDPGLLADVEAGRRPLALVLLAVPELTLPGGDTPGFSKTGLAAIRDLQGRVLAALAETGWQTRHRYTTLPALTGVVTPQALAVLRTLPEVRRVGPDARLRGAAAEALPYVGADAARTTWNVSGAGVTVAIFDSGIARSHPDFDGRVLVGGAFLNEGERSDAIDDDNGHGTNVAGVLASAGAVAHPGVAPGAGLLIYKVLDQHNAGWISDWSAAVDHAAANFARWPELRVSNASLESDLTFRSCPCSDDFTWVELAATAWSTLAARGVVNVACSGNDGKQNAVTLPGCLPDVVAVGTVYTSNVGVEPDTGTYQDAWSDFAACADERTGPDVPACFTNVSACLDLLAPGVHVVSDDRWGGATQWYTGTSQASPVVAGAAALLFQAAPGAAPDAVTAALLASGVPVGVAAHPSGVVPRLDIPAAIAALLDLPRPEPTADDVEAAAAEALADQPDDDAPRARSSGCAWGGAR